MEQRQFQSAPEAVHDGLRAAGVPGPNMPVQGIYTGRLPKRTPYPGPWGGGALGPHAACAAAPPGYRPNNHRPPYAHHQS